MAASRFVEIDIQADGLDAFLTLQAELETIRSLKRWFAGPASTILKRQWREQFREEGGFWGSPWEPLSDWTLNYKASKGFRMDILRRTDELYDSVRTLSGDIDVEATEDQLEVRYTGDEGKLVHNASGGFYHVKSGRFVPARPWWPGADDIGVPFILEEELRASLENELNRRFQYNVRRAQRRAAQRRGRR